MAAPTRRILTCSRCGRSFECGKDRPRCWCADLPALPAPKAGEDCLCRECLTQEIGRKA